jgi:hypothetical protein
MIRPAWKSGGFCEVLETHDRRFRDPGTSLLNEGAAGFARWGYGDCIFTRWRMASFGVA